MKTTPVEWLEKELNAIRLDVDKNVLKFIDKSFEIAKEMEKEQQGYSEEDMKEAFNVGFQVGYNDETSPSYLTAEKFIEQFKKK